MTTPVSTTAFHFDHHTEALGTPITELVLPQTGLRPRLTNLVYTPAGTAHDLIFMKALNKVATTAAAAAAATTVVLDIVTFTGDSLAANDYLIIKHGDGTYGSYLVSAVAGLSITINALSKAVNSGADVFIMGAPAQSYHHTFKFAASARLEIGSELAGIAECGYNDGTYMRDGLGDPALIYSANPTAAGTLNWASGRYVTY